MFDNIRAGLASLLTKASPALPGTTNILGLNGQSPPAKGTKELLSLYSQSPWLRAVVHKISFSAAEIEWRLFIPRNSKNAAVRNKALENAPYTIREAMIKRQLDSNRLEEIFDHPLLDLLAIGNKEMLGFAVHQVTQQHMDLIGEAFWLLERSVIGTPIAIWPIPPHWIVRTPTKNFPFWEMQPDGGARTLIPVTEMIMFRDADPYNPYSRGSGTAKSLGDELETDEFAAKFTKAFFYNRARPDLIISGDNMGRDDTKRLEQQWLDKHQGFWRAFKPMFFSKKIDITKLGQSMESLQMIPLRKYERDTLINAFGIPPEKLGVVNDSKRSTIAAADLFWAKDVLRPRIELRRLTMQRKLVPLFDDRLVLHFDTPVTADDEMKLAKMKSTPWAYTLDEWRATTGHPELPDDQGKQLLIPRNSEVVSEDDIKSSVPEAGKVPGDNSGDVDPLKALKDEAPLTVELLDTIDTEKVVASVEEAVLADLPDIAINVISLVEEKQRKAKSA